MLPRRPDDREIAQLLTEFEGELGRKDPSVLVLDMNDAAVLTSAQRHRIASHLRASSDEIHRYLIGICVIAPSALARSTVKAILWLAPPGVPTLFVDTEAEAMAYAQARLASVAESTSP